MPQHVDQVPKLLQQLTEHGGWDIDGVKCPIHGLRRCAERMSAWTALRSAEGWKQWNGTSLDLVQLLLQQMREHGGNDSGAWCTPCQVNGCMPRIRAWAQLRRIGVLTDRDCESVQEMIERQEHEADGPLGGEI